jgi:glutamyl-tRNA synthetase
MLRFAPSPTGDMHIGNLRVALFNYILSLQREEPLLVRIEDTDKEHNILGKEEEIFAILALFGIEYQEQQLQSNNLRFHRAMAIQLLHDKKRLTVFAPPKRWKPNVKRPKRGKPPTAMTERAKISLPKMSSTIRHLSRFGSKNRSILSPSRILSKGKAPSPRMISTVLSS